jgi:hypothetical protein
MDISGKKVEIIEWVATLQDKSLLKKIEQLKKEAIKEAYEAKLKPMTKAQLKARAEESNKAIKAGRTTSIEDLQKESDNW